MPKANTRPILSSYDDIFKVDAPLATVTDHVLEILLTELHLPEHFPFQIREDAAMHENVDNIQEGGTVRPCLVRPREAGGYEVIAGQRDVRACELAGLDAVPAIIRELDNDTATILMVNANLPQEKILPSEMAWALRMKMEAMCHRGRKIPGIDPGTLSVEILMEETGKKKMQIYRYVHLTELVPALLDMVDDNKIAFTIAADYLFSLSRKEQAWLLDSMSKYEATPSASQAQRLKKHSKDGSLTPDVVDAIMAEEKKEPIKITLTGNRLTQYFPKSYTPKQMEEIIISLLIKWCGDNAGTLE